MSYKKVGSWFLSDTGKSFVFGCATAGGIGAFCLQYVPNTFLLTKYRDIVHLYRNGITVPVPQYLQDRFTKAIDLAEISEKTKRLYNAFSVVGFDIFSAGSSYSKYGCIIGLPVNFTYTDVESIEKTKIKILSESVLWETKEAKSFLDSLVLSEKAQIYAMAREMRMTQTMKLYWDSLFCTLSFYLTYGATNAINNKFNMYAKPLSIRLTMYSLVSIFIATNYFFIKDFTQLHYEHQVDEELKHLNPLFVEGAIEFYGKILQRNKALRTLMGNEGESTYSVLGNENYLLRQRHLPLVQRKAYFESKLDPKESLIRNVM